MLKKKYPMFFIPQRWEISERLVLLREVFPVFISLQLCVCIRVHVGINTHICIYTHHTHLYVNIYTLWTLLWAVLQVQTHRFEVPTASPCQGSDLAMCPGFITFHVLVDYWRDFWLPPKIVQKPISFLLLCFYHHPLCLLSFTSKSRN